MTAHGRELTVFAQFYRYTGDRQGLLLKYFDRIMGRVYMLLARRRQAQELPKDHRAYGLVYGTTRKLSYIASPVHALSLSLSLYLCLCVSCS